ncbi:MAG: hypothetical protein NVSMB47_22300 [Polyangiales bacterium]
MTHPEHEEPELPDEDDESDDVPPHRRASARSRLESVIPDLIKKAVGAGYDRATGGADALKSFIQDSKLPKEFANAIFAQIDETKNGLFRVVAKEIRGFLEATDFQHELQKLLTTVSFEIKTEIRFIPNDSAPDKIGRPSVKADMKVKRQRERDRGRKSVEPEPAPEPPRNDAEPGGEPPPAARREDRPSSPPPPSRPSRSTPPPPGDDGGPEFP